MERPLINLGHINIALNIRTSFSFPRASVATALAAALLFPYTAQAISIGEIVSQSTLGYPLFLQVELKGEANENITSDCLSLATPEPNDEDEQSYIVSAKLSVQAESGRWKAIISSHKSFNDAFAKLKLRISCPGMGSVTKTLIFLPDVDTSLSLSPAVALVTPTEAGNVAMSASPTGEIPDNIVALAVSPTLTENAPPDHARSKHSRSMPAVPTVQNSSGQTTQLRTPAKQTARNKRGRQENFRLKLSSAPIDESRIGKISPAERELLLARQKLLDADDQMASFLTMQNQVKQLQDELGEIKLRLAHLPASSPVATAPVANIEASRFPSFDAKQKRVLFSIGLVLAILALLFGLRRYNRINSQRLAAQEWKLPDPEPVKLPDPETVATRDPSITLQAAQPPVDPPTPTKRQTDTFDKTQPAASPFAANAAKTGAYPAYGKTKEELAEADSVIEEAELYATYGHPERAALILQELIQQHPGKSEAWLLLLSILASLKNAAKFEQTAQKFLKFNKSNIAWKEIQALGRSLERDNPLYDDGSAPASTTAPAPNIAPSKRRLIGDVLVDAGVLSAEDMKQCLDNFDPKRDGRLGGYLVARKVITQEQLQQALRQQQSTEIATETPQPANPPPLHDIDRLLTDINPQPDKRLDEHMQMDIARINKPKKT